MFTGGIRLRVSISAVSVVRLWSLALSAQEAEAPAVEPTANPVSAIAISDVTDRSQEAQNRLKQIDDDVSSAPMALFRGFTDTGFTFRLLFWIPTAKALTAPSEVGLAVFDGLEREGYECRFRGISWMWCGNGPTTSRRRIMCGLRPTGDDRRLGFETGGNR